MQSTDVQIFNTLVDLVTSDSFQTSQAEFFEKHKDQFTDDEENRLEYKEIYENYVFIVDQVIDTKLQGKFSEEEVEAFYEGFAAKYKSYESIH